MTIPTIQGRKTNLMLLATPTLAALCSGCRFDLPRRLFAGKVVI
jgi:hypothetical protein